MNHTHAKGQGQRSFRLKDEAKTDRRTDGRTEAIALLTVLMRSVTTAAALYISIGQCSALSIGPISSTQTNPTHQMTDPTQPVPW